MKYYRVTLMLVIGYWPDSETPKLKDVAYTVRAKNEGEALEIAKGMEKEGYTIDESYIDEV